MRNDEILTEVVKRTSHDANKTSTLGATRNEEVVVGSKTGTVNGQETV
jgi:hypothetical protein